MKTHTGQREISKTTQIISVLCGIALVVVIFVPIWRIELDAPQYPEGLTMQIFSNKLAGDVEIINGLNHYIGMRTLHADDFVEFTVLPYIFGLFALFGFFIAFFKSRRVFYPWALLFFVFAILAMVDFYLWEYEYGHNLDPMAAIQVPGQSYQPPLIGFKQLLNFGAFSIPDIGGWLLLTVGLLLLYCIITEYKKQLKNKKQQNVNKKLAVVLLVMTLPFFSACSSGPKPIRFEEDNCDFCKMTISDPRFGAEILTTKGKAFKFDDVHCAKAFINEGRISADEIQDIYFIDFTKPEGFIKQTDSYLLQHSELRSPMGSNIAVFSNRDSVQSYQKRFSGKELTWEDYLH